MNDKNLKNLRERTKEERQAIASMGVKARQKKQEELNNKTFKEIVQELTTEEDLKELFKGLLASAKKGNVKAIDLILKCLDTEKKKTALEEFIEDYTN